MRVASFYDTNVLLYALSTAPAEAGKRAEARRLLALPDWGLSIQVLQEFYVNATRAPRPALSHADATAAIRAFLLRPCAITDDRVLLAALELKDRHVLSFWDSAVIAAAQTLGARRLYSEDLNHGQDFDGLTVVNPFVAG